MPRRILLTLIAVLLSAFVAAEARDKPDYIPPADEQPTFRYKAIVKEDIIVVDGDTMALYTLRPITVFKPRKFKNKKEEKYYWRTVRNVKILLPYAKMIRETIVETYEYMETFETQKEREAYMKKMEKALFNQYKPVLKKFSRNQARLLVKLIQRETDQSGYEIVKAFLGSFRAVFWQGFGKLFGVSLKGKYQPDKDRADAVIEEICVRVEQGTI